MKNIRNILLPLCIFMLFSCEDELTKVPDFISEDNVFESEPLTEAYLANVYQDIRFFNWGGQAGLNIGMIPAIGGEHICFADWQDPNTTYQRTYSAAAGDGPVGYYPWNNIRDVNYMIENIVESTSFNQDYINAKAAEAKYLRAYMYFEMVKRYGGVPLITKVQDVNDPEEELYPSRNTEQEVYDFIISELDSAIPYLSAEPIGGQGRADKWAALSLQSRAALYAASIANFGQVQIEGVVGIPNSLAQSYYQKSYDASKEIIESGNFVLYNEYSDKVENYINLFIDDNNSEVIFAQVFEPIIKGTSFDNLAFPAEFRAGWGCNFPVLYDMVELFDFQDGTLGTSISRDEFNANNKWDIDEFFGNRDPRFRASVFYPETTFKGGLIYFHSSTLYTNGQGQKVEVSSGNLDRNGEVWPASAHARNVRNTALLRRKNVNENLDLPISGDSGQDFAIFRLGEIYLNLAEAAYYLNQMNESLDAVNMIRERAGMPLYDQISEENLRKERQVELCFETHRYWDLVRWRTAPDYLDNVRMKGLVFKYDLDEDRYIITLKNAEPVTREFGPERFYFPIDQGIIADNPNWVQNPGYE
ncbi:RagB/SusD family nutrient uptake outer membrane protein [Echinicola sp. CAU 1574]|uniref:RagB/SusD family nutrient uptake outer membrane protein n=1 Tax=Echinicola arenosa TaxID=2774144 RepID=A0ABR9AGA3_9BACT|nr:RagB/SusD family nutrient uptake outer membrane protein [Echinicola arenosa]MBD8487777.1 RagB/SusD family nutrient uptake outer membrane protein [Echinicola arenosa]